MESIIEGAVAGLIAALTATIILGLSKSIYKYCRERNDVRHIRDVLIEGRRRVMKAKDTYRKDMDARISEGALRAAQYNSMLNKLSKYLYNWSMHLSHDKRKELFDALDWYHTDSLQAIKRDGKAVFVDLPEGKWPTTEMSMEAAKMKFEKLQSIKWLKLKAH